jgi:hypothetical protein
MATSNPSQRRWAPLPEPSFYTDHPHGPIRGGNLSEALALQGLALSREQMLLVKKDLTRRLIQKSKAEGPKVFEEPINVKPQLKRQVTDAIKAKFGAQFGWSRINHFNKNWVDIALSKLLSWAKEALNRNRKERRELQKLALAVKQKKGLVVNTPSQDTTAKPPDTSNPNQNSTVTAQKPLQMASEGQKDSRKPMQPLESSQESSQTSPDIVGSQSAIVSDQKERQTNAAAFRYTPSSLIDLTEGTPSQRSTLSNRSQTQTSMSCNDISQAAPSQPRLPQTATTYTQQNSVPTSNETAFEAIFRRMTLVVINSVFKPEKKDDEPWEDILVEYLTEEGKGKGFNRLLSRDFCLAKFKAKLADLSQSPFGFDKDLHELCYAGGNRDRVMEYGADFRTILQQAANEEKRKLFFKVRNKT